MQQEKLSVVLPIQGHWAYGGSDEIKWYKRGRSRWSRGRPAPTTTITYQRTGKKTNKRQSIYGIGYYTPPDIWYVQSVDVLLDFCTFAGWTDEETFSNITGKDWIDLTLWKQRGKDYRDAIHLYLDNPDMYEAEINRFRKQDGQDVD